MFSDPGCTGFVAMSQIPFVFAFVMKNNVFALLIGMGISRGFVTRRQHFLVTHVSSSSVTFIDLLEGFSQF